MNTGMPTIHNNLSANRGYNNDTDNSNNRPNHSDSLDLESLNMMLDPHLRPVNPIRNHATSQQIFQEHKDIAEDYLKVDCFANLETCRKMLMDLFDFIRRSRLKLPTLQSTEKNC